MYIKFMSDYIIERISPPDDQYNFVQYEAIDYFKNFDAAKKALDNIKNTETKAWAWDEHGNKKYNNEFDYCITLKTWLQDEHGKEIKDEPIQECIVYPQYKAIEENRRFKLNISIT